MCVSFENQVAVDLIRANNHVVTKANLRHAFELLPFPSPANWIMRIAAQEQTALFSYRPLKRIEVDFVLAVHLRDRDVF
jgi:hypothetical protein